MKRWTTHTAEQIVNLLRQVEVGIGNGKTLATNAASRAAPTGMSD